MNKKYIKIGKGAQVIHNIKSDIREECENPADYEGYVENCLLHDATAGALFYGVTTDQFKYYCSRALLSI